MAGTSVADPFSDLAISKLALEVTALEQEVAQHKDEKEQLLKDALGHKQVRCWRWGAEPAGSEDHLLFFTGSIHPPPPPQAQSEAHARLEKLKAEFKTESSALREQISRLNAQVGASLASSSLLVLWS
jgi:hypothetical protein